MTVREGWDPLAQKRQEYLWQQAGQLSEVWKWKENIGPLLNRKGELVTNNAEKEENSLEKWASDTYEVHERQLQGLAPGKT